MRALLWLVFALALAGDLVVGGWLVRTLRYGGGEHEDLAKKKELVQIREALFTDTTHDLAVYAKTPAELIANRFRTETPEAIERFRRDVLPTLPYGDAATLAALPVEPIARARAIALLYSVNGGNICGGFDDLHDALVRLPQGYGCCSDHAEAFLALGPALGLDVREAYHSEHAFNEVWVPALGKWVFIDTQYALMAKDPDGTYLGVFEIRERLRTGAKFEYEFFGKPAHWFATHSPWDFDYYKDIHGFANLRIIWGSNIYEQDDFEKRTAFLPRAARHVVGHVLGIFPPRLIYEDAEADEPAHLRRKKGVVLSLAVLLPLGTIIPPLLLRSRRFRPS